MGIQPKSKGKESKAAPAEKKQKPRKIRLGNIVINIWTNETDKGREYKTFTLEKIYKNNEDEWKSTQSFNLQDLLTLQTLIGAFGASLTQEYDADDDE